MRSITRARTIAASLAAVLALGGLAACGSDSTSSSSSTTTASGGITVTDVWARESAMSTGNGAVYFVITNGGSTDDELMRASVPTDVAAMAQIHETVAASPDTTMGSGGMTGSTEGAMSGSTMAGAGMMTMQEVESVPRPGRCDRGLQARRLPRDADRSGGSARGGPDHPGHPDLRQGGHDRGHRHGAGVLEGASGGAWTLRSAAE